MPDALRPQVARQVVADRTESASEVLAQSSLEDVSKTQKHQDPFCFETLRESLRAVEFPERGEAGLVLLLDALFENVG